MKYLVDESGTKGPDPELSWQLHDPFFKQLFIESKVIGQRSRPPGQKWFTAFPTVLQ